MLTALCLSCVILPIILLLAGLGIIATAIYMLVLTVSAGIIDLLGKKLKWRILYGTINKGV